MNSWSSKSRHTKHICKKCTDSWWCDPVQNKRKCMEIFSHSTAQSLSNVHHTIQILYQYHIFESTLWTCGQNPKYPMKRFLWRHPFGTLYWQWNAMGRYRRSFECIFTLIFNMFTFTNMSIYVFMQCQTM